MSESDGIMPQVDFEQIKKSVFYRHFEGQQSDLEDAGILDLPDSSYNPQD